MLSAVLEEDQGTGKMSLEIFGGMKGESHPYWHMNRV